MNGDGNSKTADTIVIGGGLHGCSAALHMAMRGMKVLVIEKDRVGRHASSANAGGVRRLGRAFPEVPLAVASAEIWQNIEDLVDHDCGFVSTYQIKLAMTDTHIAELRDRSEKVRAMGFDHEEIIDQQTLREIAPAVSPECIGAMAVKGDGFANPFETIRAFHSKCEQLGVVFRQGHSVEKVLKSGQDWKVTTSEGTFTSANLVNCAGAWGAKIAAMVGDNLPLDVRAPMLMITEKMPPFLNCVAGAQGNPFSFKQFPNGTVLIGGGHVGTAFPDTNKTELDYSGLALNAALAEKYFPIMKTAKIVRFWAGIEGYMPDSIPVIGKGCSSDIIHSFGYSAHGYQLGPVCGKIVSELVLDGKSTLPIAPFSPKRFHMSLAA